MAVPRVAEVGSQSRQIPAGRVRAGALLFPRFSPHSPSANLVLQMQSLSKPTLGVAFCMCALTSVHADDFKLVRSLSGPSGTVQGSKFVLDEVAVGARLITFNVENGTRAIGKVDVTAKRAVRGFGDRLQFSPPLALEAAGAPLLDENGNVVGILGGNVMPGARFDARQRMAANEHPHQPTVRSPQGGASLCESGRPESSKRFRQGVALSSRTQLASPVCATSRLHVIAVDQENRRAPSESVQSSRRVERPRLR